MLTLLRDVEVSFQPGPEAQEALGVGWVGGGARSAGSYLRDDGELRTEVMEANVCHIEPIDADLTLGGLQDSEQAESHGRLASPSAAHNAYLWGMGRAVRGISGFLSAPQ